jgi:hypothetical protein
MDLGLTLSYRLLQRVFDTETRYRWGGVPCDFVENGEIFSGNAFQNRVGLVVPDLSQKPGPASIASLPVVTR